MKAAIGTFGVLFFSLASIPAANAAEGTASPVIEEVIVTAQKREQSIQDVPISVSAFDTQFLQDSGVDDVLELQFFVPGLTVANNQTVGQTSFAIRGVGTAGNSLSLESSVGLYIDGVYRARQASAINDLVDIERVEVLRGPQGTLFGKNTASGAVQFITVAPQMNEWGGYIEGQAGNHDFLNLNGAINIPLVDDVLAARITAGVADRKGYVYNRTTDTDVNDRKRHTIRGQLLFEPTDTFSMRIIGDYAKIDEACCSASNIFDGPGDTNALFEAAGGIPVLGLPSELGASYRFPLESLGGDVALADAFNEDEIAMDIDPGAKLEDSGVSVEMNWDVGSVTLTSVTAYRTYEAEGFVDADFNSLDALSASGGFTEQDTFTQEFRITGDIGSRIHYVAGAYYFDQTLDNDQTLRLGSDANALLAGGLNLNLVDLLGLLGTPSGFYCIAETVPEVVPLCDQPAFPGGEGSDNFSEQTQKSWAVFAQGDFLLADSLMATLGIRYTDEKKDMNVIFTETIPSPAFTLFTPLSPLVPDVDNLEFKDDQITGTAKLSWFVQEESMIYISYGRGYKSGGTNIDRISPDTGAPLLFDPEFSDSYEIGVKADFMYDRLRLNAAVYRTDFKDFQENTFVGTGFVLQNAGKIKTEGFEVEVFALPAEWLWIQSGLAYVDATYKEFEAGACIRTPLTDTPDLGSPNYPSFCSNTGNLVPGTPEWTWYGSANASRTLGNGNLLYGQLDINWRDDVPSGNDNDPNKAQKAATLVNGRIGFRFGQDRFDIAIWGKNLFDKDYHGGGFNSVAREGSLTAYHTEPRTYGATLRATF